MSQQQREKNNRTHLRIFRVQSLADRINFLHNYKIKLHNVVHTFTRAKLNKLIFRHIAL